VTSVSRADRILIAVLAVSLILAWPVGAALAGQRASRAIVNGPEGESVLALDGDAAYDIAGSAGGLTVRVHDGAISVVEAACPDQVCVRTGEVHTPGAVIACVPNGIVVRIEGGDDGGIDAIVR
jgi:hypothetical protein